MGQSQVPSYFDIFSELGFSALCVSHSKVITWFNPRAKELFDVPQINVPFTKLRKIFKKDDEWVVAKCFLDAFDGKTLKRSLEVSFGTDPILELTFCPVHLGSDEGHVLLLARAPEVKMGTEQLNEKILTLLISQYRSQIQAEVAHLLLKEMNQRLGEIYGLLHIKNQQSSGDFNEMLAKLENIQGPSKDFLSFSERINRQTKTATDMGDVLRAVFFIGHLYEQNFKVKFQDFPTKGLTKIEGNRFELEQALICLLTNAFEAALASTAPWVRVELQETKDQIEIIFTDSGESIHPHFHSKLELAFFTTKDPQKHHGLGLTVAKDIIERHQGKILYSKNSPSTRITVRLPKKQKLQN
jgi:signal transduction histidine kinase